MGCIEAHCCSDSFASPVPFLGQHFNRQHRKSVGWFVIQFPLLLSIFLWPVLFLWSIVDAWWVSSGIVAGQIIQKSSGSWIGLKRCPGLVDFDNCDLVTYSQSLRTARADKNGNSVSFSTVLTIVSSMSILSWSTDSSTSQEGMNLE